MKNTNMSHIRKKTIRGLTAGDRFIVSRQFTEEDMLAFADVTRDYNRVTSRSVLAAKTLLEVTRVVVTGCWLAVSSPRSEGKSDGWRQK